MDEQNEDPIDTFSIEHGRRVFKVREQETGDIPLSDLLAGNELDVYDDVSSNDYFRIYSKRDRLKFQARGYIGFIPINDRIAIHVHPKVEVGKNLTRILLLAGYPVRSIDRVRRRYAPDDILNPELTEMLVNAFIGQLEIVASHGLHQEYRRVQAETSFPRGRILLGKTMQRYLSREVHHRASAEWFERTTDTAPNRCIKYTLWFLARGGKPLAAKQKPTSKRLNVFSRWYRSFDGVALDLERTFLRDPLVIDPSRLPSIRTYYEDPLRLALAILSGQGVTLEADPSGLAMPAIVLNMQNAFEAYLRSILMRTLSRLVPRIVVLDGTKAAPVGGKKLLFDARPSENAEPDIVIEDRQATEREFQYPLIIDAKYKAFSDTPPREDINQMIGYSMSYRSSVLVMVHPMAAGTSERLRLLGRIGQNTFWTYAIDLGASDLGTEEQALAEAMASLLPAAAQ